MRRDAGPLKKGKEYTITDIDRRTLALFPYELDERQTVGRGAFILYCSCGQKKVYSESKSYICPWCEI